VDRRRYPDDFAWDGALREVLVPGATAADWTRFIAWITSGVRPFRFGTAEQAMALPDIFAEIATFQRQVIPTLTIDPGGLHLNCHVFAAETIVLDFDPRDVVSAESVATLSAFVAELGRLLGKPVFVIPENMPDHPFWRYNPKEDRWSHASQRPLVREDR